LKDAGFDILMLPYYDGHFIDKIAEFATDLIVLDIIMPTMNGDQIALLLKQDERTKNIPIVFLDNLSEETVGDLVKNTGALEYLVKADHSPDEVIEKYKKYIEAHTSPSSHHEDSVDQKEVTP
jgi:CheY-like chemotaxis protein